ncbi:3',5'-cyclic-nucleotide phosphodiesterase [Nocardioides sp. Root190]|uniref:phosphodiesterase n=1 Tax=Nocardioides sp. Root190 TaxID=1736488 RepID=UPI0006F78D5B|nr:phosphodiesterase [Nocardioides sp. Root190]KRB73242.1 3',5'-cyclic-nucleotide phosphodiesterase [Nocardioides sp. Root190]
MEPLGQYPDPTHVVAHLSDPHLLDGSLLYGAVDTTARLEAALVRLARLPTPPQALVFTGDLADRAEPAAYSTLRAIVEPAAAAIGAEVVWVMGNHDDRAAYARGLYDTDADDDQPQDRVHDVAGLRIVALDTSVPGWHHGELSEDQLAWLADVLSEPAPHGTLLAMHHPPIPVPMLRLAELIELHDQPRLAEVVAGSDVRGILGGHFHFTSWSTFAGVPVSVASATCYSSELAPDRRLLSGVDAHQSFTMLHLYDDQVVHSVVPALDAVEVSGYGLEVLEPFRAMTPAERFDMVSRKDSPLNLRT